MPATLHFTYLSSFNQAGNNLQKQALEILKSRSNLLIKNPQAFIRRLETDIGYLNGQNPRCKPLRVSTWEFGGIGISLGDNYTVGFYLYPVRNGLMEGNKED